jgi:hypothetical protein
VISTNIIIDLGMFSVLNMSNWTNVIMAFSRMDFISRTSLVNSANCEGLNYVREGIS